MIYAATCEITHLQCIYAHIYTVICVYDYAYVCVCSNMCALSVAANRLARRTCQTEL